MNNITPHGGRGVACDPVKDAFWRDTLAAFAGAGQDIRQFCRERGLRESAFYFWRRTIARRDGKAVPAATRKPVAAKRPAPAFVSVRVQGRPPAADPGCEPFQVELRGGCVLRMPTASMPAARLAELVHALEGLA
jgi:hypothetical protein